MNQRYVAERGPKGLIFQIQPNDSIKLRKLCEPSVSKRKQIHSWRSKDEYDCRYFTKNFDRYESLDFRKTQQKNVFIDSYYPKLGGDFSEDYSRNSYSSLETQNWLEDTTENESSTYDTKKNAYYTTKVRSDRTILHKSSRSNRSRLPLSCNTYTLLTLSSDLESFTTKNNIHAYEITKSSSCCLYERRDTTEDEIQKESAIESREAQSNTDCFAHLYKRIETLEELLQENIEKSVQQKEIDIPKKQQKIKSATLNLNNYISKPPIEPSIGDETLQQIRKNNDSDTESELQNIKKRLIALEKKLRDAKRSQTQSSAFSNDSTTKGHFKKEELSGRHFSQTTVVLPNQVYFISPESQLKLDKINRTIDRVKKKPKCKRIKGKTSTMLNSRSLKRTKKPKHPSQTTFSASAFALNEFDTKTNSEDETILTCKILENTKKKRRKKQKSLCKKTSITNIRSGAPEGPKLKTDCTPPCSCWMTFSARYPDKSRHNSLSKKTVQSKSDEETEECKKQRSLLDLIEILKGGGKIRIPVLFEEVCKKSGTKTPGRNFSDISMRFVLVQENPKYPLKKIIRKLSRKTNEKTEHYLFGVSKCSCNNQVTGFN